MALYSGDCAAALAQYRVLAEVCERLGDEGCESEAREAALAISPLAFDPRANLLFFGDH